MRSFKLLAVAVLAFVLVASSAGHVYAQWGVAVAKIAIGGEDTDFGFEVVHPGGQVETFLLKDGGWKGWLGVAGDYVFTETAIPPGWVLRSIDCTLFDEDGQSSWEVDLANARVTVHALYEYVSCIFINERIPVAPVGGFMEPVDKLTVFTPYLAFLGIIAAVAIVYWKRPDN